MFAFPPETDVHAGSCSVGQWHQLCQIVKFGLHVEHMLHKTISGSFSACTNFFYDYSELQPKFSVQ